MSGSASGTRENQVCGAFASDVQQDEGQMRWWILGDSSSPSRGATSIRFLTRMSVIDVGALEAAASETSNSEG